MGEKRQQNEKPMKQFDKTDWPQKLLLNAVQ